MSAELERGPGASDSRVIYTCWPIGAWGPIAGGTLVLIGAAMILTEIFPDSPGIVWGLVTITIGILVVARGIREAGS